MTQELNETADPALNPTEVARDRAETLVSNLTSSALDELRKFRDETDALMQALQNQHRLLVQAIDEHAQKVASVIDSKIIMAEQTQRLRELFAPVTPVLTQLNGGQK